jgi:hypothetical protein
LKVQKEKLEAEEANRIADKELIEAERALAETTAKFEED